MAKSVMTSLDLNWLVLKNLRLDNLSSSNTLNTLQAALPSGSANEGRMAYDTNTHKIRYRDNSNNAPKTVASEEWVDSNSNAYNLASSHEAWFAELSKTADEVADAVDIANGLAVWAKAANKPSYTANELKLSSSYSKPSTANTNFTAGTTTIESAIANLAKAIDSSTSGTVTSVALSVPTGFAVNGSPIKTNGTLGITFASGYSLPTNAKQTTWDNAAKWISDLGLTATDVSDVLQDVSQNKNDWNAAYDWVSKNGASVASNAAAGADAHEWFLGYFGDGYTEATQFFDGLDNRLGTIENALKLGDTAAGIINTWNEVKDFLDGFNYNDDLATIIAGIRTDITNVNTKVDSKSTVKYTDEFSITASTTYKEVEIDSMNAVVQVYVKTGTNPINATKSSRWKQVIADVDIVAWSSGGATKYAARVTINIPGTYKIVVTN